MFGCQSMPTIETTSQPVDYPSVPLPETQGDMSYILLIVGLMAAATHILFKWIKGDT